MSEAPREGEVNGARNVYVVAQPGIRLTIVDSAVALHREHGQPARCFDVDHYFAKLITTAAIGLAQFGMEDTRHRILPSRRCSS
jgi:hypothetical protein